MLFLHCFVGYEVFYAQTREKKSTPEHLTLQVLEMLPTVNCVKPKMAFTLMSRDGKDFGDRVVMDQKEFESETFQRVYQYLRRHAAGNNLDRFSYIRGTTEGTPHDCLQTFLMLVREKHCIVNTRCACTARVTVLGVCVCLCVCSYSGTTGHGRWSLGDTNSIRTTAA